MDGSAYWPARYSAMQRYFTKDVIEYGEAFELPQADVHHVRNVMRFKPGDTVHIVDASRRTHLCKLLTVEETVRLASVELIEESPELPVDVTVLCPLLKGEKFEWMLQKATELGAHAFQVYAADRGIVKLDDRKRQKRLERFEKIIKEASEQSRRQIIPEIGFEAGVDQLDFAQFDHVFFAFEGNAGGSAASLGGAASKTAAGDHICIIFGPEGGFSEREIERLSHYNSVHLGPRILRAETAPLYALSAISTIFEAPPAPLK